MKYLIPDYYPEFECIGGTCPYTCCAQWSILVDDVAAQQYKNVSGSFGDKLRANLSTKDDLTFFQLSKEKGKEGRCPFLTKENLCEIYQQLGKDSLCVTCTTYPRSFSSFGDIQISSLMISCPEVAHILFKHSDPIQFHLEEDSKPFTNADHSDIDWALFNTIVSSFTVSIALLQNRRFSLSARLKFLILFHDALESCIAHKNDPASLFDTFSSDTELEKFSAELSSFSIDLTHKLNAFLIFCKNITGFKTHQLPQITEQNISAIENFDTFFKTLTTQYETFFENYCVYFLSQYYLSASKTGHPMEEIKQLIYLLNLHHCYLYFQSADLHHMLSESDLTHTFVLLSRAFEHSAVRDHDIQTLCNLYSKNGMDSINYLLSLI